MFKSGIISHVEKEVLQKFSRNILNVELESVQEQ